MIDQRCQFKQPVGAWTSGLKRSSPGAIVPDDERSAPVCAAKQRSWPHDSRHVEQLRCRSPHLRAYPSPSIDAWPRATSPSDVCDLLLERDRDQVRARIGAAWSLADAQLAEQRLELLVSGLDRTWPDAAGSLREGMSDALTLIRLGISGQLAMTLSSTNPC